MTKKNRPQKIGLNFLTQITLGLFIVFHLHVYVLESKELPVYEAKIVLAYGINGFLALVVFAVLFFLRIKHRDQLGFLFMFGSVLKFAFFFIFFNASYKADGVVTTAEFMAFFIPYGFSLFTETLWLVKLLNLPEKGE